MRPYDWEDLKHFLALARTLNLSAAANQLGTSQVTVMRRVRSLERALGIILFIRRRDGHRLTKEGSDLRETAMQALEPLDTIARKLGADDRMPDVVRITTTEIGANLILIPRLRAFQLEHPHVALVIDSSPEDLDLLEDDRSIALRFHRPTSGSYTARKIGEVAFAAYADNGVSERDQTGLSLIGWAGRFSEIALARRIQEMSPPDAMRLTLTSLDAHMRAAACGAGIAVLPCFAANLNPDLKRVSADIVLSLDAWLVIPTQTRNVPRIKQAAAFVETSVRQALGKPKNPKADASSPPASNPSSKMP